MFISAPYISQVVAEASFDCQDELRANIASYRRSRDHLLRTLPAAGFTRRSPAEGAFYLFADITDRGNDSVAFCARMLAEAGSLESTHRLIEVKASRCLVWPPVAIQPEEAKLQEPLRITFRDMPPPAGIEDEIRARAADLEQFFDRITACTVVVEARHRHQRKGNLYHVRIDLIVPGREIVVQREPAEHHAHEDLPVTIRDAFNAVRRQLQDHVRAMQGRVKTHDTPTIGRIIRLFPDYGFLGTESGDEVYLHRNAVLGRGFDKLNEGDRVRYVIQDGEGEHGPQASTVVPL